MDTSAQPAEASTPVQLPRITIKFCTSCKWMLRATYVSLIYLPRILISYWSGGPTRFSSARLNNGPIRGGSMGFPPVSRCIFSSLELLFFGGFSSRLSWGRREKKSGFAISLVCADLFMLSRSEPSFRCCTLHVAMHTFLSASPSKPQSYRDEFRFLVEPCGNLFLL